MKPIKRQKEVNNIKSWSQNLSTCFFISIALERVWLSLLNTLGIPQLPPILIQMRFLFKAR